MISDKVYSTVIYEFLMFNKKNKHVIFAINFNKSQTVNDYFVFTVCFFAED